MEDKFPLIFGSQSIVVPLIAAEGPHCHHSLQIIIDPLFPGKSADFSLFFTNTEHFACGRNRRPLVDAIIVQEFPYDHHTLSYRINLECKRGVLETCSRCFQEAYAVVIKKIFSIKSVPDVRLDLEYVFLLPRFEYLVAFVQPD